MHASQRSGEVETASMKSVILPRHYPAGGHARGLEPDIGAGSVLGVEKEPQLFPGDDLLGVARDQLVASFGIHGNQRSMTA
jgi:hypothetical protein